MESKTQPAWYENVAGKKHRKKISSAKKCGQSPKGTADSFSSPVNKTYEGTFTRIVTLSSSLSTLNGSIVYGVTTLDVD